MAPQTKNIGLRDVPVADTKVSFVDGEHGRLFYRGYAIQDLGKHSTFEETAYLLLYQELPTQEDLDQFSSALAEARGAPDEVLEMMRLRRRTANPMDVLQTAVPMLADDDPELSDDDRSLNLQRAVALTARIPTLVAAWDRTRRGSEPLAPLAHLGHAANFLYMLTGKEPDVRTARDLDLCFILYADHGFNASTFTARCVASTRANIYTALTAALGSLSGPLHGGAIERVMAMLEAVGDMKHVEEYVNAQLDTGQRIMGLGHAVYKVDDPRALILRGVSEGLGRRTGDRRWYELSRAIEVTSKEEFRRRKGRDFPVNVDFYAASVYRYMDIPMDLATCLFAMSRIAGWCAHIIEEKFAEAQPKPELYRPDATYVGRYCGDQGCEYLPMERRTARAPQVRS